MLDLSLTTVLPEILSNPALLIVMVLGVATLLMNGAHDASNAIATCIATRSMSPAKALVMAAVCNFLGLYLMTFVSTAVAETIFKMVNFNGDYQIALIALAAAMVAIVLWGALTWFFGIPSSQSHALIAGLTGAAIALQSGISGINGSEWIKVIWGLIAAAGLGFGLGWLFTKLIGYFCRNLELRKTQETFGKLQDIAAGLLAFLHGAQDGQKFMSVFILAVLLAMGHGQESNLEFPLWIVILSSTCMCLGTVIGGRKIIKSVGMNVVKLEKWQGFSATFAASICILIANLTGLPISTTHTKTTAIMGVGTAKRLKAVNWLVAKDMVWAWVFTFPGCGLIGFGLAKLFMAFVS